MGIDGTLILFDRPEVVRRAKQTPEAKEERPTFLDQYRDLISADEILEAGCRLGAIQRQRKIDLPKLVEATIAAMVPVPGAQTSILVNYLSLSGQDLAVSSFYDRFSPGYAQLMKEIAERALRAVREADPDHVLVQDIGALLEEFSDVRVVDSTTHMLKKLARAWAPSTSKVRPAGVKFHAVISLRDHLPIADAVTPQRVHDNRAFPEEAMAPGTLCIFDLGYVDTKRFIDATERGAHFLTRLKSTQNPEIVRVHVGKGSRIDARGRLLDDALREGVLACEKGVLDLDVRLKAGGKEVVARVTAILDEEGDFHWYLTSVDRNLLDACDVAEAYRLRWIVELIFKQMKSGAGLDTILAWRDSAVIALIHAKVIGLCLARLLELSVTSNNTDITTRLALIVVLARCSTLLIAQSLIRDRVSAEELERRILLIAKIVAKARNRRRERVRRQREAGIGHRA